MFPVRDDTQMTTDDRRVACLDCGADRTFYDAPGGPHEPCRTCGSLRRAVSTSLRVIGTGSVGLFLHAKHPRQTYKGGRTSKPARERWWGQQRSADGITRDVDRVVDRQGDWYEETALGA